MSQRLAEIIPGRTASNDSTTPRAEGHRSSPQQEIQMSRNTSTRVVTEYIAHYVGPTWGPHMRDPCYLLLAQPGIQDWLKTTDPETASYVTLAAASSAIRYELLDAARYHHADLSKVVTFFRTYTPDRLQDNPEFLEALIKIHPALLGVCLERMTTKQLQYDKHKLSRVITDVAGLIAFDKGELFPRAYEVLKSPEFLLDYCRSKHDFRLWAQQDGLQADLIGHPTTWAPDRVHYVQRLLTSRRTALIEVVRLGMTCRSFHHVLPLLIMNLLKSILGHPDVFLLFAQGGRRAAAQVQHTRQEAAAQVQHTRQEAAAQVQHTRQDAASQVQHTRQELGKFCTESVERTSSKKKRFVLNKLLVGIDQAADLRAMQFYFLSVVRVVSHRGIGFRMWCNSEDVFSKGNSYCSDGPVYNRWTSCQNLAKELEFELPSKILDAVIHRGGDEANCILSHHNLPTIFTFDEMKDKDSLKYNMSQTVSEEKGDDSTCVSLPVTPRTPNSI
jgi:hypothetical protein